MRRVLPFLSIALAACDRGAPQTTTPSASPPSSSSSPLSSTSAAPVPASGALGKLPETPAPSALPRPPLAPADLAAVARSNNAFGLDLYAKVRGQAGNLALSPLSISTALTMTWAGARGETAAQMKRVLHAEGTPEKAASSYGSLLASLGSVDHKVTVRVANRLFGEKEYPFKTPFLDLTRTAFGAPLEPVDFKHAAEDGRKHINDWVATETQDRIKDLIPKDALTEETRLVLTNAIYFLGGWSVPFNERETAPAPFQLTKTETRDVPTMTQVQRFGFAALDGVKVLEMPYQGGDVAMTLVLPDAVDGIDAVEKRLSPAALGSWVAALRPTQVKVSLPRFEINPPQSLSLGERLAALGMPLAFDRHKADFTAMADPPRREDRLCISKVFHKAFVKVDEKGTEAAAATAVGMAPKGRRQGPSTTPPEFRADHPFLFFLRDVRSGVILFLGRVASPAPG